MILFEQFIGERLISYHKVQRGLTGPDAMVPFPEHASPFTLT